MDRGPHHVEGATNMAALDDLLTTRNGHHNDDHHYDDHHKDLPYTWYNDPNSTASADELQRYIDNDNNTLTYVGYEAINLTDQTLSDVGVIAPWIAPFYPDPENPDGPPIFVPMEWDNREHGWLTSDFFGDDSGVGLLVTLKIVPLDGGERGYITAGRVASDENLNHVFGPNSNADGLPGFPTDVTLDPGDRLPFADLGPIGPNGSKAFNLIYEYHWEDGYDYDVFRTASQPFTLAPAPKDGGHDSGAVWL